jgi:hypothetical protein
VTAPVIANIDPPPGEVLSANEPVSFDVTDDSGSLLRVIIGVAYSSGALAGVTEIAHDGDSFIGFYTASCTRDPISDGFHYSLVRDGGWPASPTVVIFAFDHSGNED